MWRSSLKLYSVLTLAVPSIFFITPVLFRELSVDELLILTYYTTFFLLPLTITTIGSNFILGALKRDDTTHHQDYFLTIYSIDALARVVILSITFLIFRFDIASANHLKPFLLILFLIHVFNALDNAFSNICFILNKNSVFAIYATVRTIAMLAAFNLQWFIGFETKWYFLSLLISHFFGFLTIIFCHLTIGHMRMGRNLYLKECLTTGLTTWPSTLYSLVFTTIERFIIISITPSSELIIFELIRNTRRLNSFFYSGIERVFISQIDEQIAKKRKINYNLVLIFTAATSIVLMLAFPNLVEQYYGNDYISYAHLLFPAYTLLLLSIMSLIISRYFTIHHDLSLLKRIDFRVALIGIAINPIILILYGVESVLFVSLIVPTLAILYQLKSIGYQHMSSLPLMLIILSVMNGIYHV